MKHNVINMRLSDVIRKQNFNSGYGWLIKLPKLDELEKDLVKYNYNIFYD